MAILVAENTRRWVRGSSLGKRAVIPCGKKKEEFFGRNYLIFYQT